MNSDDRHNYLSDLVKSLPNSPGVYQFFNNQDQIIYIGKAKNLKKRVSSYFSKQHYDNAKVRIMVNKICDLKFIVVNSESDALHLENNLIKEYRPRYNVLLKDDKTYPWICIKNEPFPRIFQTRNLIKDGSLYFGPYSSVTMIRTLLELVKQLFPLRSCSLALTEINIASNKFKVCLEYHLGNCKAPCIGNQLQDEYDNSIQQIKNILKGNIYQVIVYLKSVMKSYAEEYKYELAEVIRRKIEILERYQSKTSVVNSAISNVDVFSFVDHTSFAVVNYLKIVNGLVIQSHTVEIVKRLDESSEDLLALAILEIRDKFNSESKEIVIPFKVELLLSDLVVTVPKIGDKKTLIELSEKNARQYLVDRIKNLEKANPEYRYTRILDQMQKDLRLAEAPNHIECFDNSNIQGTSPVAACVVFKNGKPAKSDYRHFNIKTVEGPNDYASMEEVLSRRYTRLIEEGSTLPQLVIIDGGKGQLGVAVKVFQELNIYGKVALIGIAKRLEEIYFPGDSIPIYLDKQSESLKLIQQIRDETHRFGITFHRNKRSSKMTTSAMESIPGVGPKTIELLYSKFSSISNIKNALDEQLIEVIGKKKTEIIRKYLAENAK